MKPPHLPSSSGACSPVSRPRASSPRIRLVPFARVRDRAACCLVALIAFTVASAPRARAQTAPAPASPTAVAKEDVSVMSEFKVYDKKPVPFTDANMDIPRGINDVQPYYIIGA